jgi:hypothetical protein
MQHLNRKDTATGPTAAAAAAAAAVLCYRFAGVVKT